MILQEFYCPTQLDIWRHVAKNVRFLGNAGLRFQDSERNAKPVPRPQRPEALRLVDIEWAMEPIGESREAGKM
jgi:hypothetical protein